MATTPVEFRAPTGLTLTLELYAYGSDTIGNTGGDSATEATNRKGLYSANVTEALAGWYTAHVKSGSTVIAVYDVFMVDDTNVHRCTDRPQDMDQETIGDMAAIGGNANAPTKLGASAGQIIQGTVDTVTNSHTPTTTEFQADDITEATANHYKGRVVIFTSGVLAGQATSISSYLNVGGIGQFTVVALTEAPSNNDTFIIV